MAFRWKLKERLAVHHQLYQLADIQRVIEERTGVRWSLETISQLVNKTPRSLRVQTMQTVCTAFDCRLDDICEITPDAQPGFAKLLNCNESGSYEPETITGTKPCGQRGGRRRDRKKSRAVEGQIDLAQLFPEARQFSNSR
jgi:DNA-binding Xre family transcriptional regulator